MSTAGLNHKQGCHKIRKAQRLQNTVFLQMNNTEGWRKIFGKLISMLYLIRALVKHLSGPWELLWVGRLTTQSRCVWWPSGRRLPHWRFGHFIGEAGAGGTRHGRRSAGGRWRAFGSVGSTTTPTSSAITHRLMCCKRRGSACTTMLHVKTKLIASANKHNPKKNRMLFNRCKEK